MNLSEWIFEHNEEALLADGFDAAILGIGERCGQPDLVVYDGERCIKILMDRDGMDYDTAAEFFSVNTVQAWVGPGTPMFLWRYPT